jgi:hypothetical protein
MSGENFLFQAFIYLAAAVVAVPVARRFGLGSVLGYLLAGVVIGPFGLGLLGEEGEDLMHFAEFGVVLMLFVVGLELQPMLLWRLRTSILGLGGLQVVATTLVFSAAALALGLSWQEALAVGMTMSLSSTAIVLQTLNEKGLLKTDGGQGSFAVLLFQDIAVIPMLALFPLLAASGSIAPGLKPSARRQRAAIKPLPSKSRLNARDRGRKQLRLTLQSFGEHTLRVGGCVLRRVNHSPVTLHLTDMNPGFERAQVFREERLGKLHLIGTLFDLRFQHVQFDQLILL